MKNTSGPTGGWGENKKENENENGWENENE